MPVTSPFSKRAARFSTETFNRSLFLWNEVSKENLQKPVLIEMTVMSSRAPTTARRRLPSRAATRHRHPPCRSWMAWPGSPPAITGRRARAGRMEQGIAPAPNHPYRPHRCRPPEPDQVTARTRCRRMAAQRRWPGRRRDLEPLGCPRAPPTRRRAGGSA